MICPNCQREIADNSNFCYICGARQSQNPQAPPPRQGRRLMRSSTDVKIAGVCSGFADYLDVDPTIVRIVWLVLAFVPPFPAIVGYIVAWIVMPKAPLPLPASAVEHTGNAAARPA